MTSVERAADWVTVGAFIVLVIASVIRLSKWNRRRIDSRVLDYMEMHARKHSDGNRLQSLVNIAQALGMSERLATEALVRLRKTGKVRMHGENWLLI